MFSDFFVEDCHSNYCHLDRSHYWRSGEISLFTMFCEVVSRPRAKSRQNLNPGPSPSKGEGCRRSCERNLISVLLAANITNKTNKIL